MSSAATAAGCSCTVAPRCSPLGRAARCFFRRELSLQPLKRKRRYRWILAACLAPVLLLLALLLSAPLWVNQDVVKREIEQVIASATGGRAQYDRIDLHFLPMPGAELTRLRFSLPGTGEVQAQSASVDIRLLPLLLGNVYPHRVRILAPQIRIQLDEPKPSPSSPDPGAAATLLVEGHRGERARGARADPECATGS